MTYEPLIQQVANQLSLPFALLKAQVVQESSGDPNAFRFERGFYLTYIKNNPHAYGSKFGPLAACSYGLLQIMLETACEHGFTGQPWDLFDPLGGLTAGAQVMANFWKAAGGDDAHYRVALAAYNGGPKLLKVPQQQWPSGPAAYVASIYRIAGLA